MVNLCDSPVFKNVVKVITYFKKPGLVTCTDPDPLDWGGGGSGGRLILIAKVGMGIGGVVPIPLFGNVN